MGRPCVSGAGGIVIDAKAKLLRVGGRELREGDILTLDGATGEVMAGAVATVQPELAGDFGTLMAWADDVRRMKVRTNAETPQDAQTARDFGAEGIGLCRTEHMFFDAARITAVRQMILAEDEVGVDFAARAESRAIGTGAERRVEGELPRLQRLEPPTAVGAGEPGAEHVHRPVGFVERLAIVAVDGAGHEHGAEDAVGQCNRRIDREHESAGGFVKVRTLLQNRGQPLPHDVAVRGSNTERNRDGPR